MGVNQLVTICKLNSNYSYPLFCIVQKTLPITFKTNDIYAHRRTSQTIFTATAYLEKDKTIEKRFTNCSLNFEAYVEEVFIGSMENISAFSNQQYTKIIQNFQVCNTRNRPRTKELN